MGDVWGSGSIRSWIPSPQSQIVKCQTRQTVFDAAEYMQTELGVLNDRLAGILSMLQAVVLTRERAVGVSKACVAVLFVERSISGHI